MKPLYLVLPFLLVLISAVFAATISDSADKKNMLSLKKMTKDYPLRVMSFNIRFNNPDDGFNAWPHRKKMVQSMILFHQADLIGVQESLNEQMDDLSILLPDHRSVGVGRDDGAKKGEYCGIFYNFNRLNLLEHNTIWLSETPEKPGPGWDASLSRIVTWAKFQDIYTDQIFFHCNTHFDHRGEIARQKSAELILSTITKLNTERKPVLVTGDFNARPDSIPYQIMTRSEDFEPVKDAKSLSMQSPHGPEGTWSGFSFPGEPEKRIDYIFIKHNIRVLRFGTLSESWAGRFPSDHLPVFAEIVLNSISSE